MITYVDTKARLQKFDPEIPATELAPDFPTGDDLQLLLSVRNAIGDLVGKMGLREIGRGVGCGGADVSFHVGERYLTINIGIFDPANPEEPT